jgi:signal transduction histidine kinase
MRVADLPAWGQVIMVIHFGAYYLAAILKGTFLVGAARVVERRFRESMNRADEFDRVADRREILEGVAHTFRQPLGLVSYELSELRAMARNPRVLAQISAIEVELKKMGVLMDHLLRLRRGERMDLEFMNVVRIAREAIEATRERRAQDVDRLDRLGVIHHGTQDIVVPGFPELVRSALDALLDNALDELVGGEVNVEAGHVSRSPKVLEVAVKLQSNTGALLVQVCNSGPCIPVERRNSIFRPFESTKPEGTGLGLYFAREFVRLSGGTLEYVCRGDRGWFEVALPRAHSIARGQPAAIGGSAR